MQFHHHRMKLIAGVTILLGLASGAVSHARWMRPDEPVPVERLISNTQEFIRKHPKDARGYYLLGRLHSLAYANGMAKVALYTNRGDKQLELPEFPAYESILVKPENKKAQEISEQALKHFHQSVRNYRRAVELDPKNGLYYLGLGWMLEQGHLLGKKAGAPPNPNAPGKATWREKALAAYHKAFSLAAPQDRTKQPLFMGMDVVSIEAVEGMERLQKGRSLSPKERQELASMRETVQEIRQRPRAVTPIIFPLTRERTLQDMLSGRTVDFDIAGDDIKRQWPWVKPDVGILVWDPEKTGRITSGRQLFGSSTFWMFWNNGYEPLAVLDNNRDGRLTEKELEGIAVWRDADSNGVSDKGEVTPVRKFGVKAIEVQASGRQENTLYHRKGILLSNGTSLPTFDWTPIGKPMKVR